MALSVGRDLWQHGAIILVAQQIKPKRDPGPQPVPQQSQGMHLLRRIKAHTAARAVENIQDDMKKFRDGRPLIEQAVIGGDA